MLNTSGKFRNHFFAFSSKLLTTNVIVGFDDSSISWLTKLQHSYFILLAELYKDIDINKAKNVLSKGLCLRQIAG
jgi:hypothetical protein